MGAELDPQQVRVCAHCRRSCRDEARFCGRCGADLALVGTSFASARALDAEHPGRGIATAFSCAGLLLVASLAGLIGVRWAGVPPGVAIAAVTAAHALVTAAYAIAHRRHVARGLGRVAWSGRLVLEGVGTSAALALFALGYFSLVHALGFRSPSIVEPFRALGWPLGVAYALTVAAPALIEEVAFRGVVLARLEEAVGARDGLLLQAALFAVLHLSPIVFPSHFVIGLLLGRLRVRTASLYPGMLVHAGYNAVILSAELIASHA